MLHTNCPRTLRALAAACRRARFSSVWGPFRQRTIDRRYCGLLAASSLGGPAWFARAARLAGGLPSAHCWQPATHA